MKIITVTEPRFYTHYTTGLACKALAEQLGFSFEEYWIPPYHGTPFRYDDLKEETEPVIAVIHAAHLKIAHLTVGDLRFKWKNAKIITLGSDTLAYVHGMGHDPSLLTDPAGGFEFDSPREVDLHLDMMQECVEYLQNKGVITDYWIWTASEAGIDLAREIYDPYCNKFIDCICFANPDVSAGDYRLNMINYLHSKGVSIRFGGSIPFTTLDPEDLKKVYRYYLQSHICVGTTSPSWMKLRSTKGWRDWVGPALKIPLVYDNHPDIIRTYGDLVPTYSYNDLDTLANLVYTLKEDNSLRHEITFKQRVWLTENTIEKQFLRIFKKYGFV